MERASDGPGKTVRAEIGLAGLILLPGLLVAGLTARDALITQALHGRIIAQREFLDGLGSQVRMVRARKDLINARTALIASLERAPDPTPGWERVLASVPPEATAGRVVFCGGGSGVTIHGRRADDALLAQVARELEANPGIQRVERGVQGSDGIVLTVVPQPLPQGEDAPP